MKLSLMTYGLGKHLDRAGLLQALREAGFEGVEWRLDQNQPHGIEVSLDAAGRRQAAEDCRAAGIALAGIASGNRYHVTDPGELRSEIEATKARIDLAADLGAPQLRVFGNNFPKDVPRERTVTQIAQALQELCDYAAPKNVAVCLELHGEFSWQYGAQVAEQLRAGNFGLIWNSVSEDIVDGSLERSVATVRPWLRHVHMHDLAGSGYPYRELFRRLIQSGYQGFLSAEVERREDRGVGDVPAFLHYYGDLFRALVELARRDASS
jgi:sugar phosphate isomerase/epimerase